MKNKPLKNKIITREDLMREMHELEKINAYIWRKNETQVVKTFAKNKEVASIVIDPFHETADIDEKNNSWNIKETPSKFDVFKAKAVGRGQSMGGNPIQKTKK